ncbi:hypothetical protein [Litorilituus lipolyticus]|uniref:Uncharacterized protein n=1 Tax=Litorilituus lipolyticus TaxID=2491017 RepID=A0A502KU78_9GAMM|nr:hypothetical protein [Litorilituus lipolyticus]TPH15092.1 hypothetical protein EPA86_09735 [Litorilituus lipolyticus]
MFTILSNEAKLISFLQQATHEECVEIKNNFEQVIELLSAPVAELLANRRHYGVLLPQGNTNLPHSNDVAENTTLTLSVLLNEASLIQCINMLCLTEAVIVRDNFDNCLELTIFNSTPKTGTGNNTPNSKSNSKMVQRVNDEQINNVSPIRINEVKQRLTQAMDYSDDQKAQIKNKLNKLLFEANTTSDTNFIKQA